MISEKNRAANDVVTAKPFLTNFHAFLIYPSPVVHILFIYLSQENRDHTDVPGMPQHRPKGKDDTDE